MRSSGIGGQAVIEGVMMKNRDAYSVAVRKPDGNIEIKKESYHGLGERHAFARLPIIRGIVAFAESLVLGMKTITYSASFYDDEEPEEPGRLEKTFGKVFKEKAGAVVTALTVCASVVLAVGVFMILPFVIAELFQRITDNAMILALVEGAIRMGIFIAYVAAISRMEDIRRVFMYHGAEHKSINCVESGKDLTVENVRTCSRQHKRCGTSFLFFVMAVSILFFLFIQADNVWLRMLLRVLLVPVIAGVSYEFIRLAGSSDSPIVNALSKPGLWLQSLTTREPDDSMIEVAIASVEAVFDWKAYQASLAEEGEAGANVPEDSETEDSEARGNVRAETAAENDAQAEAEPEENAQIEAEWEENARAEAEPEDGGAMAFRSGEKVAGQPLQTGEEAQSQTASEGKAAAKAAPQPKAVPKKAKAAPQPARAAASEAATQPKAAPKKAKAVPQPTGAAASEAASRPKAAPQPEAISETEGKRSGKPEIQIKSVKRVKNADEVRSARRNRERQLLDMESAMTRVDPDEDEDDEILKALDRFFVFDKGPEDESEKRAKEEDGAKEEGRRP